MLKEVGLDKAMAQHSALWIWNEVVGEAVAKRTHPETVKHHILTVNVDSPVWRQELTFQKSDIVKKLNQKLGSGTIKDIRFL